MSHVYWQRGSLGIKLTELCNRLLYHLAPATHRTHQLPVDVRLTVFAPRRMSQVHASHSRHDPRIPAIHLVATTPAFPPSTQQIQPTAHSSRTNYRGKLICCRHATTTGQLHYQVTTVEVGLGRGLPAGSACRLLRRVGACFGRLGRGLRRRSNGRRGRLFHGFDGRLRRLGRCRLSYSGCELEPDLAVGAAHQKCRKRPPFL